MRRLRTGALGVLGFIGALGCAAPSAPPTEGSYTVVFPSTAAAVATDVVQVLVFDVTSAAERSSLCQDLVTTRLTRPGSLARSAAPVPSANICEMLAGQKSVTVDYGEKALLVVAQRKDERDQLVDFLLGCAVMTIGRGDAPLPIPLRLVSVDAPVPSTSCGSVGEFCAGRCD